MTEVLTNQARVKIGIQTGIPSIVLFRELEQLAGDLRKRTQVIPGKGEKILRELAEEVGERDRLRAKQRENVVE